MLDMKRIGTLLMLFNLCEGKIYNTTCMLTLGESIRKVLENPEGRDPVNLDKESYIYYAELEETFKYIKLNMSEGFATYDTISKNGGPPQLRLPVDYGKLLRHGWYEWEVSSLRDIYEDTADVWNRIRLATRNVELKEKKQRDTDRIEHRRLEKARRRKENDERVRLKLLMKEQRLRVQRRKMEELGLVPNITVITAPPRARPIITAKKKRRSHIRFGF